MRLVKKLDRVRRNNFNISDSNFDTCAKAFLLRDLVLQITNYLELTLFINV